MLLILLDWNNLLSGLIGAVVGGLIAAVSTMWAASKAAKKSFDYSRNLQNGAEKETTRRLLLAIKAEVETIWSNYQQEVGCLVESLEPGHGLNLIYKLRQHYFTVYDSNAQFLGHVEDDKLRVAIIRAYTLAKGLVDSHLLNNDLLAKHRDTQGFGLSSQTGAAAHWRDFGITIKAAYEETKESVELLLQLLNQSELLRHK
jgi:hypothetical protein